ncbi:hypothetical protein EJ04DRAFT_543140 [Polyplosphaeria fusca]|uniref:Cell cycle control protein cwf19 n=1 Tax=Polyplosphaeria fusca TaxID=682080 RepID=A0A9P4QWG3_9PLEO|nr:hypothetical protein EJ04DRAFT_543140 [Polyplosphaeria fusca]
MGLEDFERELAEKKEKSERKKRDRSRSRSRDRELRHHHRSKGNDREHRHHHSSRHHRHRDDHDRDDRHGHKRSRHHRETSEERARRKRRERERDDDEGRSKRKSKREDDDSLSDHVVEKDHVPPDDDILDQRLEDAVDNDRKRDSWMEAPSSLDVEYVRRKKTEEPSRFVSASTSGATDFHTRSHLAEVKHHLADLHEEEDDEVEDMPAQRDVSYEFGDAGSSWRMTKLKGIYRSAKEEGRTVEEVAMERYGDLRDLDEAREEEIELDRRKMYGKDYVGKIKPSGELFEERRLAAGIHRPSRTLSKALELPQEEIIPDPQPTSTVKLDLTALNKLKAQLMKAKMKKAPNAAELEAEYNAAAASFANRSDSDVVVLSAMDNRMLAGGRNGEVKEVDNKRGRERGTVVENDDMSIDDMVRQERRTKGQSEGMLLAEKIGKDAKFDNDLDYLDENASKLAARAPKSSVNLRNAAIADYQRTNRILDSCPLCHHEDKSPPQPPVAPIISLGMRTFLTLPTAPEISDGGAVIVPIQHRTNLLECDDDEWDEIRNFMKSLTRLYHEQGRDVLFYENAVRPHQMKHAALNAVPIPFELGATAPAYFKEAILQADEEWAQHKPLIDTLKNSRSGMGKAAFRRSIAKEMPYFHVWFELDGGLGHVVEDERRWPRGDLFAREILGGMLDVGVEVVRRQGGWNKGDGRRVEGWRRGWGKWDWTRALEGS